jgi:hypothetical protein
MFSGALPMPAVLKTAAWSAHDAACKGRDRFALILKNYLDAGNNSGWYEEALIC